MAAKRVFAASVALFACVAPGLGLARGPAAVRLRARTRVGSRCVASAAPEELTVTVRRGAGGGLGLEVSNANLVLLQAGQPDLRFGDIIVGVNGTPLAGGYVGKALDPAASEYAFTVSRRSAEAAPELEAALRGFGAKLFSPNLDAPEVDGATRARVEGVLAALEAIGTAIAPAQPSDALLGFWKLLFASGRSAARGLTGMAQGAGCEVVAHWQALSAAKPTAQIVEVIADPLLRRHAVAALKGSAAPAGADAAPAAPDGTDTVRPVCVTLETYQRLELDGAPMSESTLALPRTTTYLSAALRVVRFDSAGGGDAAGTAEVAAYWKTTPEEASAEIKRLAAEPLGGSAAAAADGGNSDDEMPLWERRRREDAQYDADASGIP